MEMKCVLLEGNTEKYMFTGMLWNEWDKNNEKLPGDNGKIRELCEGKTEIKLLGMLWQEQKIK